MLKKEDIKEEIIDRIDNFVAKIEEKYKVFVGYNIETIKFDKKK